MTVLLLIPLLVVILLLSAFFSGFETGFFSSNPIRVRFLAENDGNQNARRMIAHYEQPGRLITTILVGNNLCLVVGTIALTAALGGTLATIVATPLFLFFGEILPKSVFRTHPTRLSLKLMPVMRFFDMALLPLALPVSWLSNALLRMAGGEKREFMALFNSLEEMRSLVDESMDRGSIEPVEQEMIHSVMDLQTRLAKEIMVPRIHIKALPETATRGELVTMLIETGKTRIPVYSESIDHIIGVATAFDVLNDPTPEDQGIRRLVRGVMHVPDTMKLDDLLQAMRAARQSMAIVTDEYGGTDGLIAIEDILEEIFGEIHDEYDVQKPQIRQISANAYVVDARMSLEDCAGAVGIAIDDGEVETVGGWISHVAGRIPLRGEVLHHGPFVITVLEGTPTHVSSARLEITRIEQIPETRPGLTPNQ